jgi:hypothetical protein
MEVKIVPIPCKCNEKDKGIESSTAVCAKCSLLLKAALIQVSDYRLLGASGFYFWFDCVCSASNNAQSRIGTAPDIRFGKDKKKIGKIQMSYMNK